MRACISTEQRFARTPDGRVWALSTFDYRFWGRYLSVFDELNIIARVIDVKTPPEGQRLSSGPNVIFSPITYYIGPKNYLKNAHKILPSLIKSVRPQDAVILRVPSLLTLGFTSYLKLRRHPFAVEVIGDPYDVFLSGAIGLPEVPGINIGKLIGAAFARGLRRQCSQACAAAYVTESKLQADYPPGQLTYSTNYSSIEIGDDGYIDFPKRFVKKPEAEPYTLITIGSLEQMYKAPDVLINAIAECVNNMGLRLQVIFLGEGRHLEEMRRYAKQMHVEQHIDFLGQLPSGAQVNEQLDKADLFVLPSRTEGLPRAMIEAMARGLPCIGTSVGGIPELIPLEDRIPVDDAKALASKIRDFLCNPQRMNETSIRNWNSAKKYHTTLLNQRRISFYRNILQATQA